jgi:hypothetical protein
MTELPGALLLPFHLYFSPQQANRLVSKVEHTREHY